MAEERRVLQDCINASNPYHECVEYCFRKIAEAKAQTRKIETDTTMGKTDENMETKSRLDAQEEQLRNLASQMESLHQQMVFSQQSQDKFHAMVQESQDKLQVLVMQWLKKMDKQPILEGEQGTTEQTMGSPSVTEQSLPTPTGPATGYPPPGFGRPTIVADSTIIPKKVKLPSFSGTDPRGWLTRAETYFQIHDTPEYQRVPLAHVCMEGVAVHWFTIVRELYQELTWDQFKTELLNRFGGTTTFNPYEQLAALRQKGTVDEYIDEFELIASMVPRESETLYVGYFLNGLKEEIRNWVRLWGLETRLSAINTARNVEVALGKKGGSVHVLRSRHEGEKEISHVLSTNQHLKPMGYGYQPTTLSPPIGPHPRTLNTNPVKTTQHNPAPNSSQASRNRGLQQLSRSEWEEHRRKGLCFKCGQQFSPQHQCPAGQLRVLLLSDDEDIDKEGKLDQIQPEMAYDITLAEGESNSQS